MNHKSIAYPIFQTIIFLLSYYLIVIFPPNLLQHFIGVQLIGPYYKHSYPYPLTICPTTTNQCYPFIPGFIGSTLLFYLALTLYYLKTIKVRSNILASLTKALTFSVLAFLIYIVTTYAYASLIRTP